MRRIGGARAGRGLIDAAGLTVISMASVEPSSKPGTGSDRRTWRAGGAFDLTVIVCTYRRPQIVETLASLRELRLDANVTLHILVIDNDEAPSARSTVEGFFAQAGMTRGRYVHAPKQNIAVARNAGLMHCGTDWAVMMDDDETAAPDCLQRLLDAATPDTRVVFGRTRAIYPEAAPAWMTTADLHSNTISAPSDAIDRGYTSIVLLDVAWIKTAGIDFDLRLGKVGGEDILFFHQIYRAGGRLHYEPAAIVYEPVEPHRMRWNWYLKRRFRAGQIEGMVKKRYASSVRWGLFCVRSLAIVGLSAAASALTSLFDRARMAKWVGRLAQHVGVLAYGAGRPLYQEYG